MVVVQIDGENFSFKRAPALLAIAQAFGSWQEARIYGNDTYLHRWQPYSTAWHLHLRKHTGGRQAADRLLCHDAKTLYQQGARLFLLAADDGGYTPLVRELIQGGCQVFVAGSEHAARKLKRACTTFFVAPVLPTGEATKSRDLPAEKGQETMTTSWQTGSFTDQVPATPEMPMSEGDRTQIITQLYQSQQLPTYFATMLYHLLDHTVRALSSGGEGSSAMQRPQQYVHLLEEIAHDPIFSRLLVKQRKGQWEQVLALARCCDAAYEQGAHAAAATSCLGLLLDPSSTLSQEVQRASAPIGQPEIGEQPAIQQATRHWYQLGYRQQQDALAQAVQSPWSSWYDQEDDFPSY